VPARATSLAAAQGWLYELLRWAGVSDPTAAHLQQVVVKPLSVVIIVLIAALAGWLGNRAIRHWIGSAVRRAAARADSPRAERRAVTLTAMLANVWRAMVVVIAVLVSLGTVGINLTPLLAGATVVGAALAFGAQTLVRDLLSGFLITVEGQFDIGDTIVLDSATGTTGVVEDLSLRVTRVRGVDGAVWFVPNGEIRRLGNTSRSWARATVDVEVPAATEVDVLLGATRAAGQAVTDDDAMADIILEPPLVWGIIDATFETLTARVTVRTTASQRDRVERALREEAARQLRQAGVFADRPAG